MGRDKQPLGSSAFCLYSWEELEPFRGYRKTLYLSPKCPQAVSHQLSLDSFHGMQGFEIQSITGLIVFKNAQHFAQDALSWLKA